MGLRDQILAASDQPREALQVPEWGCTVYVRTLSAAERDAFEASAIERVRSGPARRAEREVNLRNLRARLAVLCLVDEQGSRIFADDDAEALGRKSAKVLARIYEVASRLNGLREEDMEELVKNSVNGQLAASPTA